MREGGELASIIHAFDSVEGPSSTDYCAVVEDVYFCFLVSLSFGHRSPL